MYASSLTHWMVGVASFTILRNPLADRPVLGFVLYASLALTVSYLRTFIRRTWLKCEKILCSDAVVLWRACAVWMNKGELVRSATNIFMITAGAFIFPFLILLISMHIFRRFHDWKLGLDWESVRSRESYG
jgi:ABC-type Fe3+-siderophore transport system permease subunit